MTRVNLTGRPQSGGAQGGTAKSLWPPGWTDGRTNACALRAVPTMRILKEDLEMDAVELIGCSNDWGGATGICSPVGGDINYPPMSRQFHMKACAVLNIYGVLQVGGGI